MMIRSINPFIQNNRIHSPYIIERRLFKVLVVLFALSIGLYVYSLSSVIYGVVERRALDKEITLLNSDIGTLEALYLSQTNTISYASATTLGYTKPHTLYYESQERVAFTNTTNQRNGL